MEMKYLLFFGIFFMLLGCSSDSEAPVIVDVVPENSIYLKVNGTKVFSSENQENLYVGNPIYVHYDIINVNISYGKVGYIWNNLSLYLTTDGELVQAILQSNTKVSNNVLYKNYKNFPSNYFTISDFKIDENTSKIHFKLNGKLYLSDNNLSSESINLTGEVNTVSDDSMSESTSYFFNSYGDVDQYCNAKINDQLWIARFESTLSTFTSVDPYKIELHFDENAVPANYNFDANSTDNYIKFSKFNTATLVYDYYNAAGVLSHSYREFHGDNSYSFIGTYSFTATNINNPLDVIQVTDGKFRSFQKY